MHRLRMNLAKYARWESSALNIFGMLLFSISLLLLPSAILSVHAGESAEPFAVPMVFGLIVSIFLVVFMKRKPDMGPADGIFLMLILWMGMFTFGIFPYLLSGVPFVDAVFESLSGFATVGASVLDVTKMSRALLLWRSMTNWIGGIMIVSMFMFILPMVVSGSRRLVKSETFGARTGNLSMKLGTVAKQFLGVYVSLTVIFILVFLLCGLSVFESVNLAFSAISVGGFTTTADSVASYSIQVRIALLVMMILSATNFYLHFRAVVRKDFSGYKTNEEFKYMIIWLLFISVVVIIQLYLNHSWSVMSGNDLEKAFEVVFNIFSLGTTAGFVTFTNPEQYGYLNLTLILLIMLIGGSSGSAAGGIKISRAIIVLRAMLNEIRNEVHPNAVYNVQYEGSGADKSAVHASIVIVIMFLLTVVISTIVFDTIMNWDEAIFTSVAFISGTGTTIGACFSGYASLPGWAKLFACVIMFLGRMEVVTVLAVFTLSFWKELLGPRKIKKMQEKAKSPFAYAERKFLKKEVPGEEPSADAAAESSAETSAETKSSGPTDIIGSVTEAVVEPVEKTARSILKPIKRRLK